ncbi:FimV/HubP family polar landmark protein [Candidatus Synchoanobacter obligatus]|uniref:Tetratricopeptide repeat protein n=1 Tax=Candidatus Synchoanobacter obligatus TaxID=2919597 RepID=A0ABT1L4U7_9GAMM|nr:FimV/HubP family polar landmark protein [Candidatus Synchoanobacter obligatus]MCP8351981.1 hypothetical protein [Candidatus Synchoanobacter obligatus]
MILSPAESFTLIAASLSISALIVIAVFREHATTSTWCHVGKDEYNFMGSEDSEQSRLDLAEAFIDIGQTSEAQTILNELHQSPNPITKERAKQLLRSI